MDICVAGDIHGRFEKFYSAVEKFGNGLGISFDVVLQVGDLGVWIDENYHDGITKFHKGTGEFPDWYRNKKAVPIKTYFINGNNEDFEFLNAAKLSGKLEILKNLFYIPNGTVAEIKLAFSCSSGRGQEVLTVAGMGGKYDPEHSLKKKSDRYYTSNEIAGLIERVTGMAETEGFKSKNIDVFLSHDAPEGVLIEDNDMVQYYPKAKGLRELISKIKPRYAFFGHHHGVCKSDIDGIPVYGLNILGHRGSLLYIKMKQDEATGLNFFEKPVLG